MFRYIPCLFYDLNYKPVKALCLCLGKIILGVLAIFERAYLYTVELFRGGFNVQISLYLIPEPIHILAEFIQPVFGITVSARIAPTICFLM